MNNINKKGAWKLCKRNMEVFPIPVISTMQISYNRVKTCYKIKINYRESKSCFYGFFQHQSLSCQPSKATKFPHRAAFTASKRYSCKAIVEVLVGKSGAMTHLKSHFYNPFVYVLSS